MVPSFVPFSFLFFNPAAHSSFSPTLDFLCDFTSRPLILFYSPLIPLTCQFAIAGPQFGRCSVEVTLSVMRVGVLGDHCIFNPDLVNGAVTVV